MNQPNQPAALGQSGTEQEPALLFSTANDLPRETREPVVRQLNRSLADTTDLMTQMKAAHWNVKGIHFYQLHLLFDEIAEMLEEHADMLAERATSLGGQARGTVRMAAGESRIPELDLGTVTGEELLRETVENLAIHAATVRADIDYAANRGDESTADLYTEISREVDQQLYFLESHLQTRPVDTLEGSGTAQQGGPSHSAVSGDSQTAGGGPHGQDASQPGSQPSSQQSPQRVTFTGTTQSPPPGQGQF